jgi:hypothetical protein
MTLVTYCTGPCARPTLTRDLRSRSWRRAAAGWACPDCAPALPVPATPTTPLQAAAALGLAAQPYPGGGALLADEAAAGQVAQRLRRDLGAGRTVARMSRIVEARPRAGWEP